jgi:hypothetical protein
VGVEPARHKIMKDFALVSKAIQLTVEDVWTLMNVWKIRVTAQQCMEKMMIYF